MKIDVKFGPQAQYFSDDKTAQDLLAIYVELAKQLGAASGLDEWEVDINGSPRAYTVYLRSVSQTGGESNILLKRTFSAVNKTLYHDLAVLQRQFTGKGLADLVLKASVKALDQLGWSQISLHANLDVGGYAWLRKGFTPDEGLRNFLNLRSYLPQFDTEELGQLFRDLTRGLTDLELRTFVLSDQFRQFKTMFASSSWSGMADVSDPVVRAALIGPPAPAAPPAGGLTNTAVQQQVALERLKAAEARDFNRLLPILEKQLADALTRLNGPVSDLTRVQLNGLLRELRGAQRAALNQAQTSLLGRLQLIAAYEAELEAATLNAAVPRGAGIVAATAEAAWENALAVPLSATGDLLDPFVRDMTQGEVDQINKVVMRAHAEGWTNDELLRVVRGTKSLNYTDGLMRTLGRHNQTLVRTAIQHVSNQAREATWVNSEITKYRWTSTLDSRTSSQCRTLDGDEFTIGKGPRPPIHMSCRSTTVAVIPGFEDLSDSLTRASANGQVSGSLSYYEWLKTQPSNFQDLALGKTRAKLFRDGGLSAERFAELQLGTAFQPLSLEELKKLAPDAFRRAGIS